MNYTNTNINAGDQELTMFISDRYGTPGAPSMTIYAAHDSLTDSTSSQSVCNK